MCIRDSEDALALVGGHSCAVVLDGHEHPGVLRDHADRHAAGTVPDGVVGEVAQQLAEKPRIPGDAGRTDARPVDLDPSRPQASHLAQGQVVEVDGLVVRAAALVEPGEQQQ